jgi:putative transposase
VRAHQAVYPIATMCRVLGLSTSGYYAWKQRRLCARSRSNAWLLERIAVIHERSGGTYGAPRVHAQLTQEGVAVGYNRVARLMREARLRGVSRRRWVCTTQRDRSARPATDLVRREFTAAAPDQLWVADITYIATWEGFLYLAVVLDVFSRKVVGWAMRPHLLTELVLSALDMALSARRPRDVIHHSDQGTQYTSVAFGARCEAAGVKPSMGSVGDCYDKCHVREFLRNARVRAARALYLPH